MAATTLHDLIWYLDKPSHRAMLAAIRAGGATGGSDGDGGGEGGGESGSGGGDGGEGGGSGEPSEADKKAAKLQADLDAANKLLADAKKKEADAKKAAADKKKKDEEGAEALLKQKAAELDAANAELERLRTEQKARADKLFKSLPEESQTKLAPVKDLADSMPDKWMALLEAEAGATGTPKSPSQNVPPTGSPMPPNTPTKKGETYKPSEEATKMLGDMMHGDAMLRQLTVVTEKDDDAGALVRKFTMPVKKMFDRMKKIKGEPIAFRGPSTK